MKRIYQIVDKNGRGKFCKKDREAFKTFFTENGQALLPLVCLIEDSKIAVDELIEVAGRSVIETVLLMSVENLSGAPHPGKHRVIERGLERLVLDEHGPVFGQALVNPAQAFDVALE